MFGLGGLLSQLVNKTRGLSQQGVTQDECGCYEGQLGQRGNRGIVSYYQVM